ncbi:MAG TPA: GNAT family N-acetyltransferase [Longimicrobiaceae bacterium]
MQRPEDPSSAAFAPVTIEVSEHPSQAELDLIAREVRSFNRAVGGHEPPRPVGCFLRDDAGRIVGGVRGDLWGRSVHVAALWVAESHRGQGHGAALMEALEACAAAQGHVLAYVETLSFQARPFYERLGYRVFAELEGIAEGCTFYFLRKDLVPASPAA